MRKRDKFLKEPLDSLISIVDLNAKVAEYDDEYDTSELFLSAVDGRVSLTGYLFIIEENLNYWKEMEKYEKGATEL